MPAVSTPAVHVVSFVAPVTYETVFRLRDATFQAKQQNCTEIHIHLASNGGDLLSGFAVYHHLRSLGVPIKAWNIGSVESASIIMYLAADQRFAASHTTFLLHDFNWTFGTTPRHNVLREACESLDFDSERYAEIFDERTGKDFDIRQCLQRRSRRLNTAEAFDAGITTSGSVSPPTIPAGAIIWWI